ncbi:MAG: hypothetical protein QF473_28485 [Planctomycetota bacterium]|nr:hypothetical protein [Planctomycetota bacterium]
MARDKFSKLPRSVSTTVAWRSATRFSKLPRSVSTTVVLALRDRFLKAAAKRQLYLKR